VTARWSWLWIALAAVLAVGVIVVGSYLTVTAEVEVLADGERQTTRTAAEDVAGVLARLDIELGDADEVTPPPDTEVEDGLTVTVTRAVTAQVLLDDRADVLGLAEERFTVTTVADTMAELLAASEAAGAIDVAARFDPALDTAVHDGDRLEVEVAVPVTIDADGQERELTSYADTVEGALADAGVSVGADDRVEPDLDTVLAEADRITIARVEVTEEVEEVTVEHGREERPSDELLEGETEVATDGRDGLRRDTYEVVLVDGEEESRERIAEEVIEEPVDEVVLIGTAEPEPAPEPDPEPAPSPPADGPVVHLTFDDGPNATYTPQVLDLLAAHDARATFFVVGEQVADHPDIAARIVDEGHAIGNHTWSHARLTEVPEATFTREILDTQAIVEEATGTTPSCLRPPFGARDETVNQGAADLGLEMAMWDIDPRDWERPGTDAIVDHVLAEVEPGAVVLLHDGFRDREQTVAATERLLEWLTDQGYRVTPMPGC